MLILPFVQYYISAGKETKEILGPEAQTDEVGCTGTHFIKFYYSSLTHKMSG